MTVSGIGTEQLLRVLNINSGIGEAQASAVIIYTDDRYWYLRRKIKGSALTPQRAILDRKLGREL